jgi:hypothetical protein
MKTLTNVERIRLKPKPTNWNFKDLEGRRFGKLYVVGYLGKPLINAETYWLAHCDCGTLLRATMRKLADGKLTDCGCMERLRRAARK